MNFILLSDYYHPIIKSGSIIVGDLADELINQGHSVLVVTFVDNQNKKIQLKKSANFVQVSIKSSLRKYGRIGRLWAEMSYSRQIINYFKKSKDIDVDGIICYSPSIFYGKAVRWLKKKNKVNSYLIIRDIFPKWALDSGVLKKGILYSYFKYVERNLYESNDFIGIEAKSDLSYFINYGLGHLKLIEVLNNWGSTSLKIDKNIANNFLDLNKVNIVYGGNMGDAQDIFSLIKLIDFSILGSKAQLVLIGSGNQFKKIKDYVKDKKIRNVSLFPTVSRREYLSIMSEADVGLVSLGKNMESNNYPLKMIGYMQLSKPILASVNKTNEIIQMIDDNNIGLVSIASDKDAFNKNLNDILVDNDLRAERGLNALNLFNNKFNVKVATSQITEHFL
jgi:O26-antigen biosynthesis N-acetyl-L-fucosamine transferase